MYVYKGFEMNILFVKQISILSLIFGAILGVITLIPYIGILSFLVCTFAAGSLVIYYMQKIELLGEFDTKAWTIYGAISGFVCFIGFCLSFVPLAALIGLFAKTSFYLGISIMFRLGFFLTIAMSFFIAVLAAIMNGFGSMTTSYVIELLKNNNQIK